MELIRKIKTFLRLLVEGNWRILFLEIFNRGYKNLYAVPFALLRCLRRRNSYGGASLSVRTDFPLALSSPDHLIPFGTKNDNSTNRKFVLLMDTLISRQFPHETRKFLDLGCAGGQLVKDFHGLDWLAVGLEGSDYSLKHRRAAWKALANKNLFTADISKPFQIFWGSEPVQFHLITAWEVLEHIPKGDLAQLLANIVNSLVGGGYFIASTSTLPDLHEGVDFHQTKMTPSEWKEFIEENFRELEFIDLGLKGYQLVRYAEKPYFVFKKR